MVFKIRDKSLFWTRSGWKNNWEPKILNMPRPINVSNTMYISNRTDHHSFLRMCQSYRNYSRIIKQYLYGNKELEQSIILQLRNVFKIPYTCQTPVELIKYGPERRMADQLDRDYELMTYNYHPAQLYIYEENNKKIRRQNEQYEARQRNEDTPEIIFEKQLKKAIAEEETKQPPGQKLSLEKLTEIFMRLSRVARESLGQAQKTRDRAGQFNDFLEKRRPFLNPDNERPSH